jgi:hypothetical protein
LSRIIGIRRNSSRSQCSSGQRKAVSSPISAMTSVMGMETLYKLRLPFLRLPGNQNDTAVSFNKS